jgi:phosphoglycolate phosphatase-like HAD superfamily hydrolase
MPITIAIDFDGVIHEYSEGWGDGSIYDPPITGSIEALNNLVGLGYNIFIFSSRSSKQIKRW